MVTFNNSLFMCVIFSNILLKTVQLFHFGKKSNLHGVVMLFRHGDRSPLSTWPTDPYFGNSTLWPDGYGQLNNKGKRRHFDLGRWFRDRYGGFLPARYNNSDIYVRSTDVDRTIMSAAVNLAGLYSPMPEQVWNDNIPWQPIPVHSVPVEQDGVLAFGPPCPRYELLMQELLRSNETQAVLYEHQDVLDELALATGFESLDFAKINGIFSTVTIYREFNLSLPNWTEEYWPDIATLSAIGFKLATYNLNLSRLRTGLFFSYLLKHLHSIHSQVLTGVVDYKHPKFLMLSAHDSTIADVTNSMGAYTDAVPEFASTVIWELRSKNNEFIVNLYFKNSTGLQKLRVDICEFDCKLDYFKNRMSLVAMDKVDWTAECQEIY